MSEQRGAAAYEHMESQDPSSPRRQHKHPDTHGTQQSRIQQEPVDAFFAIVGQGLLAWSRRGTRQDDATGQAPASGTDGAMAHGSARFAIWNEPNQEKYFRGTRDEYLHEILRPGLERLRDRAPQVARCGPDLSSSPPKKPHEWLKDVLRVAGDLIDIITHHQYDGRNTPRGRATELEEVRKLILQEGYGDRHLWITETGWKRGEVTAWALAAHLAGMFEVMAARREWWKKTFWFDSHGPGEGLLGPDGAPDRGQPFAAFNRYAVVVQETHQA